MCFKSCFDVVTWVANILFCVKVYTFDFLYTSLFRLSIRYLGLDSFYLDFLIFSMALQLKGFVTEININIGFSNV